MTALAWSVLGAMGLATVGLLWAVYWYLPKRVEDQILGSLRAFSTAIELRFPSHRGLTDRVLSLSQALGVRMGLSRRQLRDLEAAAYLRDIGLCAVPYRLLNHIHPSDWSEREVQTYERHGEVSANMLEAIPSLQRFARLVRGHHLPYQGREPVFPFAATQPIEARILTVVTTYTWIERQQGDLIAREALREGRDTFFDGEVVDAFLGVLTSARARSAPTESASLR